MSACAVPVQTCSRAAAWIGFGPVEAGPVATLGRELVGACLGDRAVGRGDVLVEDDRRRAVQGVVGDRGHLVHVLTGRVDERIVRVELRGVDRVAPVVGEQRHDRLGAFDLAAVDQLSAVVVAEGHVLRRAERLEGLGALVGLVEGEPTARDEREPDDRQENSEDLQSTVHDIAILADFDHCSCGASTVVHEPDRR